MAEIREITSPYHIAKQLYAEGNYKAAKDLFLKYVDEHPDDPDGWKWLSDCFHELAQNTPREKLKYRINYLHASMECLRRAMEEELKISRKERLLRRSVEYRIFGFTSCYPRRTFL